MPQDEVKLTKFIVLISVTMFLAIVSIICLIFIIKIRSNPNMLAKPQKEEKLVNESTESINEEVVNEVESKPLRPREIPFEEDLSNIKNDTLDKIKNTYDENELDEF